MKIPNNNFICICNIKLLHFKFNIINTVKQFQHNKYYNLITNDLRKIQNNVTHVTIIFFGI